MPLLFNTKKLDRVNVRLSGELPLAELDLDNMDELIHPDRPLRYDLEIQKLDGSFLVRGALELPLRCECVRCLKPFVAVISLKDWSCLLSMDGEDKVLIVNDSVDLTPYVREDIVLAFPQHPLCGAECGGLRQTSAAEKSLSGDPNPSEAVTSIWAALDELKF